MHRSKLLLWVGATLAAALVTGASAPAQTTRSKTPPRQQMLDPDLDVEELTPGQIQRAQEPQPPASRPAARPAPKAGSTSALNSSSAPGGTAPPARAVACSGAFAKDSSHVKLAMVFGSQNVAFSEVDGPEQSKLMASVLFPKDPKRRLEVLWDDEVSRSGTSVISINGQSAWTAPKGLHLGLGLAAVEKLNGKPFRLKGFDGGGQVTDWQNGALATLPGGCKVGARWSPDPKASADARAQAAADQEFLSSDAAMRGARPTVAEILIGY